MDWYTGVIEVIDTRSFTSIWYWIIVAVTWSSTSHWTMGVPFDAVTRARRAGGEAQDDLELLARVNVNRILNIIDQAGLWVVGFATFLLSMLGILGFWYDIEIFQAILLIVGPLTIVALLSVRSARRIRQRGTTGSDLRIHITRQRFVNQFIGLVSIFITAFWGMWHNLSASVL